MNNKDINTGKIEWVKENGRCISHQFFSQSIHMGAWAPRLEF